MKDVRKAQMCSRGCRKFFDKHGLDWGKFLKEGVPEEELIRTGDSMALHVVEVHHGRK